MQTDVEPPPFSSSALFFVFCFSLFFTFWEVKDCVQWYKTSLSLLKGLGSAVGSSHSSPSVILPSSSMAEMGHQLQLVGVTWLEDAMTERFVRVEERSEEGKKRRERHTHKAQEREREREVQQLQLSIICSRGSSIRQYGTAPVLKSASPPNENRLKKTTHTQPNPYASIYLLEHAAALTIKSMCDRITSHDELRYKHARWRAAKGALQWKVKRLL